MFSLFFHPWSLFLIIFDLKLELYTSKSPPGTPPHSWKPKNKIGERLAKLVLCQCLHLLLVLLLLPYSHFSYYNTIPIIPTTGRTSTCTSPAIFATPRILSYCAYYSDGSSLYNCPYYEGDAYRPALQMSVHSRVSSSSSCPRSSSSKSFLNRWSS